MLEKNESIKNSVVKAKLALESKTRVYQHSIEECNDLHARLEKTRADNRKAIDDENQYKSRVEQEVLRLQKQTEALKNDLESVRKAYQDCEQLSAEMDKKKDNYVSTIPDKYRLKKSNHSVLYF